MVLMPYQSLLSWLPWKITWKVPFSPVPVTLQTFAVVLAGAMLGPIWGPISQVLYIGAGISAYPLRKSGGVPSCPAIE